MCRFHPRCPSAFEICGWIAEEVMKPFALVLLSGRYAELDDLPSISSQTRIRDYAFQVLFGGVLSENDLQKIRNAIRLEAEEAGVRALRAVQEIKISSEEKSTLTVLLFRYNIPRLTPARYGHLVACHLYTEVGKVYLSNTKTSS
jgi:hypothetical protein